MQRFVCSSQPEHLQALHEMGCRVLGASYYPSGDKDLVFLQTLLLRFPGFVSHVEDQEKNILGYFSILPLRPETYFAMRESKIKEVDLVEAAFLADEVRKAVLHIGDVVLSPELKGLGRARVATQLLCAMARLFSPLLNRTVCAFPVTPAGFVVAERRLGLTPAVGVLNGLYEASEQKVVRAVASWRDEDVRAVRRGPERRSSGPVRKPLSRAKGHSL